MFMILEVDESFPLKGRPRRTEESEGPRMGKAHVEISEGLAGAARRKWRQADLQARRLNRPPLRHTFVDFSYQHYSVQRKLRLRLMVSWPI
jgi:hypothetical protein